MHPLEMTARAIAPQVERADIDARQEGLDKRPLREIIRVACKKRVGVRSKRLIAGLREIGGMDDNIGRFLDVGTGPARSRPRALQGRVCIEKLNDIAADRW